MNLGWLVALALALLHVAHIWLHLDQWMAPLDSNGLVGHRTSNETARPPSLEAQHAVVERNAQLEMLLAAYISECECGTRVPWPPPKPPKRQSFLFDGARLPA